MDNIIKQKTVQETLDTCTVSLNYEGFKTPEELINTAIKIGWNGKIDTNIISDGYHTFGELYDHRITNFITLCKLLHFSDYILPDGESPVWRSKKHSDGELAFGGTWFVLGIFKEEGEQITYHLPIEEWDRTSFAIELGTAPEWDGHTSQDVLDRLNKL